MKLASSAIQTDAEFVFSVISCFLTFSFLYVHHQQNLHLESDVTCLSQLQMPQIYSSLECLFVSCALAARLIIVILLRSLIFFPQYGLQVLKSLSLAPVRVPTSSTNTLSASSNGKSLPFSVHESLTKPSCILV